MFFFRCWVAYSRFEVKFVVAAMEYLQTGARRTTEEILATLEARAKSLKLAYAD